jgi:UDP-glucose 4-epimerase
LSDRVLVTGGAGFIGSHVVDRLVEEGYSVGVVDNLSAGSLDNISGHVDRGSVDFVEADVRDRDVVARLVHEVDAVVHLAAVVSVPFSLENPNLTFDVNVKGTRAVLTACARSCVRRFIFVSSCAVYGAPLYLPIDEVHPTGPISPYAVSKLKGERCCREVCGSGLDLVILRLFNVYGRRQAHGEYSGVIAKFLERAEKGEPLVIYGDGSQTRDFVHVSDVAEAILTLVKSSGVQGVFNVGCGRAISIGYLAEKVLSLSGKHCRIVHESPRDGDIPHSVADISKAWKAFAYEPKVTLEEGLLELLLHWRVAAR